MSLIKLGILREEKIPHDKRVPFTPEQCVWIKDTYPHVEIAIQPSDWRAFRNQEYTKAGIMLKEDISDCDLLMGIKEVPQKYLIPNKKYLFFSHTIKKQPHNREMLKTIIEKKDTLIDYECFTDPQGNRIIGFGRYAGIVGAYNAVMAYGKKYNLFNLKPAHLSHDKDEIFNLLENIHLPNIKIAVTGSGRVSNGACETLGALKIRKVTPYEFLNYSFREAVYAQLHSHDYYVAKDHSPFSAWQFHHHPEDFRCTFSDPPKDGSTSGGQSQSYSSLSDILIHCTYWDPRADILFTKTRMRDPDFKISVIADVTCDLNGSIPSTTQVTTIEDKFYGYDPFTEKITEPFKSGVITVMAIDNLPCELPRDASEGFGKHLFERVLPSLLSKEEIPDDKALIQRATIVDSGKLTERFNYLKEYVG